MSCLPLVTVEDSIHTARAVKPAAIRSDDLLRIHELKFNYSGSIEYSQRIVSLSNYEYKLQRERQPCVVYGRKVPFWECQIQSTPQLCP